MCLSNYHQVETKDDEVFLGWKVVTKTVAGKFLAPAMLLEYSRIGWNTATDEYINPELKQASCFGFHVFTTRAEAEEYRRYSQDIVVRVVCKQLLQVGETATFNGVFRTVTCQQMRFVRESEDVSAYRSLADFVREDAAKRESDAINS